MCTSRPCRTPRRSAAPCSICCARSSAARASARWPRCSSCRARSCRTAISRGCARWCAGPGVKAADGAVAGPSTSRYGTPVNGRAEVRRISIRGMGFLLRKLQHKDVWERILRERLTEPLHLNGLSLLVWAVGSYRAKIAFDLVVRQWNAYGILKAADQAKALGISRVSLVEFGVAAGAGLMNMAEIARRVTHVTGVQFRLYGFDTGAGLPPPTDYRDHPDLYQQGECGMDVVALRNALPPNAELVLGRADWIKHIYYLHVLDHPHRSTRSREALPKVWIENPYLKNVRPVPLPAPASPGRPSAPPP